ncbi:MAG: glycosyltransferase [Candidatus Microsaccharimonas sossegonensis]|uniref:Glycosyltransferase n=1 Tax=Candidatus Microsaccharimonas sossegonensis TaxID=2506948 RepID=A0A4Q0AHB1_9BACT|nr:MAG: glycosyltransferase [Candidatus Microsaccharimonas sossegonensis]
MKRVLMVDAQVFQTVAWHRGMGKYSSELISAIAKLNQTKKRWVHIEFILSSRLPIEDGVLKTIGKKMGSPKFVHLDLSQDEITNAAAVMGHNRKIIDAHVAEHAIDSIGGVEIEYLILSPMQGGVCSVFPSNSAVHKGALFYDLIPFMFHEIYFRNKIAEIEFLTKLTELLKADVYLAISKTVANDLAIYLGVDPTRIKSIDGGPIEHATRKQKVMVNKPFILMPTGNDLRKNNRVGIQGFNEFNRKHDNTYTLVITSYFDPDQIAELSKISENVVFTGNVSGEELNYLYEECEVLLFPSEYEGLGLPVLEAVEKNKPVACSDIMVFREISVDAFHFFDPSFATAIATALDESLHGVIDQDQYNGILDKYTWEASANAAVEAFEHVPLIREGTTKELITVFAPNPEAKTAVSRTVQRLHSELSRRYNTVYFFEGAYDNGAPRPNMLPFVTEALNISKDVPINIKNNSSAIIYHIGDSQDSIKSLFSALANPGILILHTLDITKLWKGMLEDEKLISLDRYDFEVDLNKNVRTEGTNMLASLISGQQAVIVFSEKWKKLIDTLAKKIGVTPLVVVANYPASSLVYKDLLPVKKNIIGTSGLTRDSHAMAVFAELESPSIEKLYIAEGTSQYEIAADENIPTIKVMNDRYFENNVSRLDVSFASNNDSAIAAIEASRYGATPFYIAPKELSGVDLPCSKLDISGIGELNKSVERFILMTHKDRIISQAQAAIVTTHSYHSFVNTVKNVIDTLKKDANIL